MPFPIWPNDTIQLFNAKSTPEKSNIDTKNCNVLKEVTFSKAHHFGRLVPWERWIMDLLVNLDLPNLKKHCDTTRNKELKKKTQIIAI